MTNLTPTVRSRPSNTQNNLDKLLRALADPACESLCFFATHPHVDETFSDDDGPETNLPFIVAVATYKLLKEHTVRVVFDGMQLTAARLPRYGEVRQLLDAATVSNKAFFSPQSVKFTSNLPPAEAAQVLLSNAAPISLTTTSRSQFFKLLSGVSEQQLQSF